MFGTGQGWGGFQKLGDKRKADATRDHEPCERAKYARDGAVQKGVYLRQGRFLVLRLFIENIY